VKNIKTICDLLSYQNSLQTNKTLLNYKINGRIKSFSNQEFYNLSLQFACGLREIGIKNNQKLANFSYQNPIWLIVDFGAILARLVTVPIFHNISTQNLIYQLKDSDVSLIFCDNLSLIDLEEIKKTKIKIIYFNNNDRALARFSKKNIISFQEVIELGKKSLITKKYSFKKLSLPIKDQDLATIIYTSGSTGRPKGVELTHKNLISQIIAVKDLFPLSQDDVAISYLPLAHIFERMVMMYYISQAISIYFVDNIKKLPIYLKQYNPTLMTTVPRLLEKVFIGINSTIETSGILKKKLAEFAAKRALTKNVNQQKNLIDVFFDKLIYKKFRQAFGTRLRMIICGGAMISEDMERFFTNIGLNLYPGYGMTETSPVIAANCPKNYKFRTVGKVLNNVKIRINKKSQELEVKGPNIMQGYHNQPDLTKKMVSKDGWLKTGDLAQIDKRGFLKITGRKKELFKTAYGKYVTPVPIEQKLVQNLGFLIGAIINAENRPFTSALLFPDFEILSKFKRKFNFKGSEKDFLESQDLKKFIESKILQTNQNLDKWQKVQKFLVIKDKISIETGEITPSMKLKRTLLEQKYKKEIDSLYNTI